MGSPIHNPSRISTMKLTFIHQQILDCWSVNSLYPNNLQNPLTIVSQPERVLKKKNRFKTIYLF